MHVATDGSPSGVEVEDVVIVGSGPAGYTAAIYAARAGLRPVLLAGAQDAGGALMTTTGVENFPGFGGAVEGPVLMEEMRTQAERFGTRFVYDSADLVDLAGDVKTVIDSAGIAYRARTVILAMGSAYRRLGVDGEDALSGHGVSWCATCDGYPFSGKSVVVVGGGDSAIEEATLLVRIGARVTLVHRRDSFRASDIMQRRAFDDPGIEIVWNTEIAAFVGTSALSEIALRDTVTGVTRTVSSAGAFVAVGHDPRSGLVAGQVDVDADGYVLVQHPTTATSIPGVFACGDLVDRRYRQAVTAAGTGCAAALDAERYLADASRERTALAGARTTEPLR